MGIGDFDRSAFSAVPNLSTRLFSDLVMHESELPFISTATMQSYPKQNSVDHCYMMQLLTGLIQYVISDTARSQRTTGISNLGYEQQEHQEFDRVYGLFEGSRAAKSSKTFI